MPCDPSQRPQGKKILGQIVENRIRAKSTILVFLDFLLPVFFGRPFYFCRFIFCMPCDHLKWPQGKNIFETIVDFRFPRFFDPFFLSRKKIHFCWSKKSIFFYFLVEIFHHLIVATNRLAPFLWPKDHYFVVFLIPAASITRRGWSIKAGGRASARSPAASITRRGWSIKAGGRASARSPAASVTRRGWAIRPAGER